MSIGTSFYTPFSLLQGINVCGESIVFNTSHNLIHNSHLNNCSYHYKTSLNDFNSPEMNYYNDSYYCYNDKYYCYNVKHYCYNVKHYCYNVKHYCYNDRYYCNNDKYYCNNNKYYCYNDRYYYTNDMLDFKKPITKSANHKINRDYMDLSQLNNKVLNLEMNAYHKIWEAFEKKENNTLSNYETIAFF